MTGRLDRRARDQFRQHGFAVLPGFLDAGEIAGFVADYRRDEAGENGAYRLVLPSPAKVDALARRLADIAASVATDEYQPQHVGGGVFFAIEQGVDFGWHQDHESFYIHQSHRDYLNVYIPVIKPDPTRSNLAIVPIDRLADAVPDIYPGLEWGGATTAAFADGVTTFRDDHAGGAHGAWPQHLDSIAAIPSLAAGDALILRGDVFHRTQDTETERVALSIRISGARHRVSREHFETTCDTKEWFRTMNPKPYAAVDRAFREHAEMPVRELIERAFG